MIKSGKLEPADLSHDLQNAFFLVAAADEEGVQNRIMSTQSAKVERG